MAYGICFITLISTADSIYIIILGSYETGSVSHNFITLQSSINIQIRNSSKSYGEFVFLYTGEFVGHLYSFDISAYLEFHS